MGRATLIGGWLAALCVGLALVFATASAASGVDRFQHGNDLPHDHGIQHADAHDDSHEHPHDGGGDTSDKDGRQPAFGGGRARARREPPAQPCWRSTWRERGVKGVRPEPPDARSRFV